MYQYNYILFMKAWSTHLYNKFYLILSLTNKLRCVIMYVVRETSYNKKGIPSFQELGTIPKNF